MTTFDADARQKARTANHAALVDLLAVLARYHGAPCREGVPSFAPSRRWTARGRNRLFADREPVTVWAATHAAVIAKADAEGLHRPECAIACDRCGHLVRVVDVRNADKNLAFHQATEKCLYRSILAAMVWQGFAPVDSAPRSYTTEQRETLALIDGPGNKRDAKRAWAPLPRVLALIDRRHRALDQAEQLTDDDYRALEDFDTLTRWEAIALQWSANAVHLHAHRLNDATDYYNHFAAQIAQEHLREREERDASSR
jgi:hypothetical protein